MEVPSLRQRSDAGSIATALAGASETPPGANAYAVTAMGDVLEPTSPSAIDSGESSTMRTVRVTTSADGAE